MTTIKSLKIVVAAGRNREIGYQGNLPWPRLNSDLKFLQSVTTNTVDKDKQNAIIMGRKTWESLPLRSRPLKGRFNVVITRQLKDDLKFGGAHLVCNSFSDAVEQLSVDEKIESIYILGGADVYKEAMLSPLCSRIYYTDIDGTFPADTFFPAIDSSTYLLTKDEDLGPQVFCENGIKYEIKVYERIQ